MYKIDIFESINMPIDWYVVYWGIKNKILSVDTAQDYVCRKMEKDKAVSEEELELSWKVDNLIDVLEIIEKIPKFQNNIEENMEKAKEKIRVAIIIFYRKTEKDVAKLFAQIEMIYAEFDYPQDMENFISYMPMDDEYILKEHSLEENRSHLLKKLDCYICEQVKKYKLEIE